MAGTTALAAAEMVGMHRNTAAGFYTRLRRRSIPGESLLPGPLASPELGAHGAVGMNRSGHWSFAGE